MTSIEQDPQDEAEEYTVEEVPEPEEHTATPSVDPLEAEADPADVAEQLEEVPLDGVGAEDEDADAPEDLADEV